MTIHKENVKKSPKTTRFLILIPLICILTFSLWKLITIFSEYQAGKQEYEQLQQYVQESDPYESANHTKDLTYGTDEGSRTEQHSNSAQDIDSGNLFTPDSRSQLSETKKNPAPQARIDFFSLKEINTDAIGWIEIPGTIISYPIVHGADNNYYLNHTFRNAQNSSGCIFLDALNQDDFSDPHNIIYGHNMKNGTMFAALKNYRTQAYQQAHPYLFLDLSDGNHCYEIFSCYEAAVSDICFTIGYEHSEQFSEFAEALSNASLYPTGVSVSMEDSILTLSTCTSNHVNRFVVHAKKIY